MLASDLELLKQGAGRKILPTGDATHQHIAYGQDSYLCSGGGGLLWPQADNDEQ